MMRLSTKGRYGARVMLELALNYDKGPILLKDIARNQEISEGYLEHILPSLKIAGLVNSSRGSKGGYTLAKPLSEISLGQIVRAVEGDLAIVNCISEPNSCNRLKHCVTREVWQDLSCKMTSMLDSISLQDLVNRQVKKHADSSFMYSI